jgi:hypothetical protein
MELLESANIIKTLDSLPLDLKLGAVFGYEGADILIKVDPSILHQLDADGHPLLQFVVLSHVADA